MNQVKIEIRRYCGEHIRKIVAENVAKGIFVMGGGGGTKCWNKDKSIKICPDCKQHYLESF